MLSAVANDIPAAALCFYPPPIAKFPFPYVSGKYRESIIGSKYQMYKRKVVIGLIIFIRCVSIHFPLSPFSL